MSISTLVQALIEASASPEAILAAVKAVEASKAAEDEARRAAIRARVTKHRNTKRGVTHRNVTPRQDAEIASEKSVTENGAESAPLSIGVSEEGRKEKKERGAPAAPRPPDKRGTRLPADWQPDAEDAQFAASLGYPAAAYDREIQKFANHWHSTPGKAGVKLDWKKTLRNWLIRGAERFTPVKDAYRPTVQQTTPAVFVVRGSPQWQAWTRYRGREPIATHHGGQEGQFMKTEWPPQQESAA